MTERVLLDSSAWVEHFIDGPLAGRIAPCLKDRGAIVVPSLVVYEVHKKLVSWQGKDAALEPTAQMIRSGTVPLTDALALQAAELSLSEKLSMADAIIVATAQAAGARIVTLDADFEGIPGAVVLRPAR